MWKSIEALESIADPRERFEQARAASRAAHAAYQRVEAAAAAALVAAHGGNVAAAAREVRVSFNGLKKILGKDAATDPPSVNRRVVQAQPALWFADANAARDALQDWALRRQEVADTEEVLFLGALAAGLDPLAMHEQAGVSLDQLRRIRPQGNIVVSALKPGDHEVLSVFAHRLIEHGQRLTARASESGASPADAVAARTWLHLVNRIATNIADDVLLPPSTVDAADFGDLDDDANLTRYLTALQEEGQDRPATSARPELLAVTAGPDAWLAQLQLALLRTAAEPDTSLSEADDQDESEKATREAVLAVYTSIAAVIDELRRTGVVPSFGGQE